MHVHVTTGARPDYIYIYIYTQTYIVYKKNRFAPEHVISRELEIKTTEKVSVFFSF